MALVRDDCMVPPQPFSVSFDTMVRCIRRNFNGVDAVKFGRVMKTFLDKCNVKPPQSEMPEGRQRRLRKDMLDRIEDARYLAPRPLDTLREALVDVQSLAEMNNSPFRHVMVISDTLAGLDVVLEELWVKCPGRAPDMVYVSSFAEDKTDFRRIELESQLKAAIEQGRTVVLVNASSMYSALYDILVRY
jgi:hypothetical protein